MLPSCFASLMSYFKVLRSLWNGPSKRSCQLIRRPLEVIGKKEIGIIWKFLFLCSLKIWVIQAWLFVQVFQAGRWLSLFWLGQQINLNKIQISISWTICTKVKGVSKKICFAFHFFAGKISVRCPCSLALFTKTYFSRGAVKRSSVLPKFKKLVAKRNQKSFNEITVNESWLFQPVGRLSLFFGQSFFRLYLVFQVGK